MSTLIEIQDAVSQLSSNEKKALQLWLNSQTEPEMTAEEEQRLLRSLDEAVRDIDFSAPQLDFRVRHAVRVAAAVDSALAPLIVRTIA